MFSQVVNHVSQRRAFAESIFQSQEVPRHINKLQRIRRIIGNILEEICHDNYQEAETLIGTLPSESLKRQTKLIIQKMRMLDRRVNNTRTSKEENQKIAKMWAEEADRLKTQLNQNNKETVVKGESQSDLNSYEIYARENEEMKRFNAQLQLEYKALRNLSEKIRIDNEKLTEQCKIKQKKIVKLEEQVSKLAHQNQELKHRSNLETSIKKERIESSIIPNESNPSLFHREDQVRQAQQQFDKINYQINECILGLGQKWQLQTNNSLITILIKENNLCEAKQIQYHCFVRIVKKRKGIMTDKSKIDVNEDKRVKSN